LSGPIKEASAEVRRIVNLLADVAGMQ
jgi:hypothetical protein